MWDSPKRFDIIVFSIEGKYFVKRIIGLPGEQVEYRQNHLYINGEEMSEENYIHTVTKDFTLKEVTFQNIIPENSYFVMGDNRSHSMDSRIMGFVEFKSIHGKLALISNVQ